MPRNLVAGLAVVVIGEIAQAAQGPLPLAWIAERTDTVHVAPPTGVRDADHASILAALAQVQPGGTIRFAPGTYRVGGFIQVSVPRVTLLGHPEGTALHGCDLREIERDLAPIHCNGLALTGGHQTVRNLTFEYMDTGLWIGIGRPGNEHELGTPTIDGGDLIEGNTFRNSINNVVVRGQSTDPIVMRHNRFVNTYHAANLNGRTVHFLDNDISAPEPERAPRRPDVAIGLTPVPRSTDPTSCANNVVAGNRIEGHPDGIVIRVVDPGQSCRHNVIRENTIVVRHVRLDSTDQSRFGRDAGATVVGVPLHLQNQPENCRVAAQCRPGFSVGESEPRASVEDNLIEGNRIMGAEGLGIEILYASRNRFVNNTITRVVRKNPFPGVVLRHFPAWGEFNGSGIWVSPGSDGNEILGNTFAEIAAYAVVLEGDRNRVETRRTEDIVRDMGKGNRIARPSGRTSR